MWPSDFVLSPRHINFGIDSPQIAPNHIALDYFFQLGTTHEENLGQPHHKDWNLQVTDGQCAKEILVERHLERLQLECPLTLPSVTRATAEKWCPKNHRSKNFPNRLGWCHIPNWTKLGQICNAHVFVMVKTWLDDGIWYMMVYVTCCSPIQFHGNPNIIGIIGIWNIPPSRMTIRRKRWDCPDDRHHGDVSSLQKRQAAQACRL